MAIATPMFWESIYTTGYTLYNIYIYIYVYIYIERERNTHCCPHRPSREILQIYPSKSFLPFTAFPQPLGSKQHLVTPGYLRIHRHCDPRYGKWHLNRMMMGWCWWGWWGLPSLKLTAKAHENWVSQRETIVFQPSILRCYVSFRDGNLFLVMLFYQLLFVL